MVNQPFRRSMQIGVICLLLRLSCIDIGLLWCIYVKSPSTSRDIFTIINRLPYRQQTHSTAWNGYTLMGFLPLSLLQLKWNKCKNETITDIWCSNNHLILYDLRCRCNSIVLIIHEIFLHQYFILYRIIWSQSYRIMVETYVMASD